MDLTTESEIVTIASTAKEQTEDKSIIRKRDVKACEQQINLPTQITWREASFSYLRHESD